MTPGVPKRIRAQAKWCLRHYPTSFEIELTSDKLPELWGRPDQND